MAIYEYDKKPKNTYQATIQLKEIPIYGGSRLGQYRTSYTNQIADKKTALGQRVYEFSNHLQNVLVVLADFKVPVTDGTTTEFKTIVVSANDYYPFGMVMEGRKYQSETFEYRYGFNGQEQSDELDENGNSYTAEFWQYDARIGRRWNLDPVVKLWESSYATFANNPIKYRDLNGDDIDIGNLQDKDQKGRYKHFRQLYSFELFLLTRRGRDFIKERAQKGFVYEFKTLKAETINMKEAGKMSHKLDANFAVKDLSNVVAGGASGLTESRVVGNKLSTTYFLGTDFSLGTQNEITPQNWKDRKEALLEGTNTWIHEIYIHGRDNEKVFLTKRSSLIVNKNGLVENNINDRQHKLVRLSEYAQFALPILAAINNHLKIGLTQEYIKHKIMESF